MIKTITEDSFFIEQKLIYLDAHTDFSRNYFYPLKVVLHSAVVLSISSVIFLSLWNG